MRGEDWPTHLAWCKKRALEYLPNNPDQAIASMGSDIGKHDGEGGPRPDLVAVLVMSAVMGPQDEATIRRWIEGWN